MRSDAPNYRQLRECLVEERFDDIPLALTPDYSVELWSRGKFRVKEGRIFHGEQPLPAELNGRIMSMVRAGDNPENLLNFWERLRRNPSARSVEQLFPFLEHQGIAIDRDGGFLAYKGVKMDYKDAYTGTVDNRPGQTHRMERNLISDDPRTPCHFGFHVGALGYAGSFSERVVICKVDPEDVVCIPYDHSAQKMRVCAYAVVGEHGAQLPDTNYDLEADIGDDDLSWDESDEDDEFTASGPVDCDTQAKIDVAAQTIAPRGFSRLHKMDVEKLLDQPTDELRRYASKGLKIINASRIPGGKVALIHAITLARGF